jgi:trans-AT polyketide synthase, acyltransferase and oxidoreductase domains
MHTNNLTSIGIWSPCSEQPAFLNEDLIKALHNIREPINIIQSVRSGHIGLGLSGQIFPSQRSESREFLHLGTLPALYPEWLGDRSFLEVHSVRFPYAAGAMFRGIVSTDLVISMAQAGMIGFFGAAGLGLDTLEKSIIKIRQTVGQSGLSWGSNLIYSPLDPELEKAVVDLYLKYGVNRIEASAFMTMSPNIVRYSAAGLRTDEAGRIIRRNYVFAKVSRPETAELFMKPAPPEILRQLVSAGKLTPAEAEIAAQVPVAEDITVEADSGGHTDNRPLPAILPTILILRDQIAAKYQYSRPLRVGAAGGLGTPSSVAGAFAMGAAYVLTGSINQAAVESGLSHDGKTLLAMADVVDVTMAPAADMFEMGVKVQVLKRGTMFSNRASQLYSIYSANDSIDTIPKKTREQLEKDVFHAPLENVWADTRGYFQKRDPKEVEKAEKNPKYLMALVFRWYLGNSANWAIQGKTEHKLDYQICCGPAMGAFNTWVKGSYLEKLENRTVTDIALNLLEGAAVVTRSHQARSYGVQVPAAAFNFRPRPLYFLTDHIG